MSSHIQSLHVVLADTYALYLKTQNYHWNIEGRHFKALHGLFEEQYDALAEAVDEIAERIRALGEKIDANFGAFAKRKTISDAKASFDENEMVNDLYHSHQAVVKSLKAAMHAADDADDAFTVDLCVARTGEHEKMAWMLRSSLPDAVRAKAPAAASYGKKRSVKKIA